MIVSIAGERLSGCVVMGIIKKIKESSNVNLALEVSNYFHGGLVSSPLQVQKFIKSNNNSKIDSLLAAINLCGEPNTPKKLYIVSRCYVMAGAKYRPKAIEYLLKYIDIGAVWEGTPRDFVVIDGLRINQLDLNRATVYCDLGKAYEGEYQFIDALNWYHKSIDIDPTCSQAVSYIADCYVKMNSIDDGLIFLKGIKKTGCKDMKLIANSKIKELNEKKAKGYVYKPRPRKGGANSSQPL